MTMRSSTILTVLAVILGASLMAGCQSSAPATPQAVALKQKTDQADLRNASAFCAMIDEANRRTTASGNLLPDNPDCEYFQRNGTLQGYSPPTRDQYSGFFANVRDVSNFSKAQNAKLPSNVSAGNKEAADIYRKLLARGFDERIAVAVTKTGAFSSAVAAFKNARQIRGL